MTRMNIQGSVKLWVISVGDVLGDPVERDRLAEHLGPGDDEQDRHRGHHGLDHRFFRFSQVQGAQDDAGDEQRGDKTDGRRLGGRETRRSRYR